MNRESDSESKSRASSAMATTRSELHDQPQIADLFGAALGRSEHGVIILDRDGCVAFWNNWIAETSGVPVQAAMQRDLADVFDEPLPQRLLSAIGQALRGRQAATLSRTLNPRLFPLKRHVGTSANAETIDHQVTIKPIDARGGRFCLIEIVDVTNAIHRENFLKKKTGELRALAEHLESNERELRNLLDSCPTGAAIVDEAGMVTFANQALADIALADDSDLVGKPASTLFVEPADFRTRIAQPIKRLEVQFRRHDGSELWAQVSAEPTTHDSRPAMLCWIHDVSDQKAVEQALSSERDHATEQAQARTEFLAMVSHEIRTPLNGMLGTARMLADTRLDDAQGEFVETIRYSGDPLLAILNDVLDMSKLEAGHIDLEISSIDLRRLSHSLITLMTPRANERANRLSISIDEALPDTIKTDPGRLRQVLLNLIGNAIKFTEQGTVNLQIELIDQSGGNLRLRFSVTDTGIGIPDDARNQLFTEFFQVDAARARHLGGTGLGLAISKRIVEAMGGVIGVESQDGQGSTFWFSIDVGTGSAPTHASSTAKPCTILLVEDNQINQKVAQNLLHQGGHTVITVDNGRDAVRQAGEHAFDLILMDIQLPELDGIEATRQIRAFPDQARARVPIVALTADALLSSARACRKAGMDEVLTKPIDPTKLTRTIAELVAPATEAGTKKAASADQQDAARINHTMLQSLRDMIGSEKVDELIELFHETCSATIEEIVQATSAGDRTLVASLAHRLKGGALNLGLGAVSDSAIALELVAKSGGETASLEESINELSNAYAVTVTALEQTRTGP